MSIELITLLLFIVLFALIFLGVPLAFALGSVAIIFSYFLLGPKSLYLLTSRTSGAMFNYVMLAVPLFMFMANVLERSGLADDLYHAFHIWMGPIRGGLAIGTVLICTAMAAMSGVSAAAVLTMGIIAVPAMLKRGYDKSMVLGATMAGGALGQLIPAQRSHGRLWGNGRSFGGQAVHGRGVSRSASFRPLYSLHCASAASSRKTSLPALPLEERRQITWRMKFVALKAIILPALLIVGVLGSIFEGVATPTEAAAIGAFGSIICGLIYGRLSWEVIKAACLNTLKSTCMVMWIMIGSLLFVSFYFGVGGADFVKDTLVGIKLSRWVIILGMQLVIFILGCLMDPAGIVMLCTPLWIPVIKALGFDPLWFGVLFIVNLEMSYLTPPFGYNLFYMKSIAPEGVTMADIYRSVTPFVALQAVGLVLCMIFPEIITWLPGMMIGK